MLFAVSAGAADTSITFAREQDISTDFAGWRLYSSTVEGGPYVQTGADIVYSGTPEGTYDLTIVYPVEVDTVVYFVLTAFDAEDNESEYSNEVSTLINVAPGAPQTLTVTIIQG